MKSVDGKIKTGDRYIIQPKDANITWLCGLYHIENDFPTFVVLTREPSQDIAFIHDRMPLILPEHMIGDWIRPSADPDDMIKRALTDMIAEKG